MHYFPLGVGQATLFAALLVGLFLIQISLLRRAYWALGLNPAMATLVLFGSLLGSYVNLPLIRLPEERVVSREVVEIFGVPFLAPVTVDWPGTILAINVGGAVIPILLSFYLLIRYDLWGAGGAGDRDRRLCRPSAGDTGSGNGHFGADLRPAACWRRWSRWRCRCRFAAPLAYIGGSLGVLSAPICSISGCCAASALPLRRSAARRPSTEYS